MNFEEAFYLQCIKGSLTPLTRCIEDENLSMGSSKKNVNDGIN